MKDDTCYVIYARLASERVPGKMLRPFAGTTLTDIALDKIERSDTIPKSDFYLCVHEPELIEAGKARGLNVFERSEASAHEDSHLATLMEWWDKLPYTYCVEINPCLPFLTVETIDKFVRAYRESEYDGMFGVVERKDYFWDSKGNLMTPWPKGEELLNTKAVGITYQAAHCLRAGRLDTIGAGQWVGSFQKPNDPVLYIIENEREMLDVDNEWEFDICEAYWQYSQANGKVV